MAAPGIGFLAERLAKAEAVPAEQRSADVRAFIETCRLQAELVEELGLPAVIDNTVLGLQTLSRWSAHAAHALKLVRAHIVGLAIHKPQLNEFATTVLLMCTSYGRTGTMPSDLGHELTGLLELNPNLEAFALLAAGLPGVLEDRGWGRGASFLQLLSTKLRFCKLL